MHWAEPRPQRPDLAYSTAAMWKRLCVVCCLVGSGAVSAAPLGLPSAPDGATVEQLLGQIQQVGRDTGSVATQLVSTAMGMVGVPYRRGGDSAQTGFDCSGLVKSVYQQTLGLVLPHRAAEQAKVTETVAKTELQPGDLVFFNTMRRAFSHVGIYIGEGKFIHAPRSGQTVRVEDMNQAYWLKRFNGASRPKGQEESQPD